MVLLLLWHRFTSYFTESQTYYTLHMQRYLRLSLFKTPEVKYPSKREGTSPFKPEHPIYSINKALCLIYRKLIKIHLSHLQSYKISRLSIFKPKH